MMKLKKKKKNYDSSYYQKNKDKFKQKYIENKLKQK